MIVLIQDQKVLLGKRSLRKKKAPGYWCPVSGHVDRGESEEAAVVREASEEIGVLVKPLRKLISTPTHDKEVMLHWWLAEIVSGTSSVNNDENSELRWFSKEELEALAPVFREDIDIILGYLTE